MSDTHANAHTPAVLRVGDAMPSRDARRSVAAALAEGGICVLPTETVYGLAVRADDPKALRRLEDLKGRGTEQAFTWHVAERGAVDRFETLRPLVLRLVERYWPGPLTLVLEGVPPGLEHVAKSGFTGVRLPAHRATQAFLAEVDFPVVMTSANPSGQEPLLEAPAILERFGPGLAVVVDSGPSRMGESSGVLRLARGRFELLREGLLPLRDLQQTAGLRLAFVCTGNTCRSPMAAGLARRLLEERLGLEPPQGPAQALGDFGFEVSSAGVFAGHDAPASTHAIDVLAERKIDLTGHRSRRVLPEDVAGWDRVYCLTQGHLDALRAQLPPGRSRHVQLLSPDGVDIPDPIGGSRADYARCAGSIETAIRARAFDWA